MRIGFIVVAVGLSAWLTACSFSSGSPPAHSTKAQPLAVVAGQPFELLPVKADFPINFSGGTVFWSGSDYFAAVPGLSLGHYWVRIPIDGGITEIEMPDDAGARVEFFDSRPIDGGVIILSSNSLIRFDERGHEVARLLVSRDGNEPQLLSSGSQQFLGLVLRDGGGSLDEIRVGDGGLALGPSVPFRTPGRVMALSGNSLATAPSDIFVVDRATGALQASVVAPQNLGLTIAPTPSGFLVMWISNGAISSRALDRSGNWIGPTTPFAAGPVSRLLLHGRLSDGGVLLAWEGQGQQVSIGGQGGQPTQLPCRELTNLSCDGPGCIALCRGTVHLFEPGSTSSRAQPVLRVVPDQRPTPFLWNGRLWVAIEESTLFSVPGRHRLTVLNPDAGGVHDVAPLPIMSAVAGLSSGPALHTDGLVFQLLTEVDGGVVAGPLMPLQTGATTWISPRVVAHEGSFLVMWGTGFMLLDPAGRIVVPAQSFPAPTRVVAGTPPGEFWLTVQQPGSVELIRISPDGGLWRGPATGFAVATSPDSMLLETDQGFLLRQHDGGITPVAGPARTGEALWNGIEFQIYPGPSRITGGTVVDTNSVPFFSGSSIATNGRGLTLHTFVESEWDSMQGRTISRGRGSLIRNEALPLGRACYIDSDCQSNHCVDSVCCDTDCGGGVVDCQACTVSRGSSAPDGTCGTAVAGTGCRWPDDFCDAPEACDGVSRVCPPDRIQDAGFVCRPVRAPCDEPELCDGLSAACPPDLASAQGTPCDDENECTVNDVCPGLFIGICTGTPRTGTCDAGSRCSVDSCQSGYCAPGPVCPAPECQVAVACAAATGCVFGPASDGSACDGGFCRAGSCAFGVDGGFFVDGGFVGEDAGSSLDAGAGDSGTSVDDGGAADAGTPIDAGDSDAGTPIDAGSVDAGSVDAGSVDAGFPGVDGGPNDSGIADAGPPDASVLVTDGGFDGGSATRLPAAGPEAGPLASFGCSSGGGALSLLALVLIARLRRRE